MKTAQQEPLAVIGMACTVPGADNYDAFWASLCEVAGDGADASSPDLRSRGTIQEAELFDAARYGISDQEALIMDPQCRRFLMLVDSAFADAGYDFGKHSGRVAVVASQACNGTYHDYLSTLIAEGRIAPLPALLEAIHRGSDFLATRVSYAFDLKGPSFNLQSGCSSSLVAVAEACHLIWAGRCEVAVAGGMTITYPLGGEYAYEPGSIYSHAGTCRPFDAAADGTVPASGGGVVVLKPLGKALESGDRIHGVVRGAGVNNDGARKVSFAAPAVDGQYALLRETYTSAGVDPARLAFVECHATGTRIGDPIEVRALKRFIASHAMPERSAPLLLGSVKGHIGHLFWSSGIVAMIKSLLALKHGVYPGTAGLNALNPLLALADSPFSITRSATQLELDGHDCGGVSSFGVGGTNAHVILAHHHIAEADGVRASPPAWQLRCYSLVPDSVGVATPGRALTPGRAVTARSRPESRPSAREQSVAALCATIVGFYEEVLGETGIADDSNYFDLHGDSISAVVLIARLNAEYGVTLEQADIYDCPTPATLAQRVNERNLAAQRDQAASVYLNVFQTRFYLLEKMQRGPLSHYNVPLCLSSDTEPDWVRFCAGLDDTLQKIPAFSQCLKWVSAKIVLAGKRRQVMSSETLTLPVSQNAEPHFTQFFGRRFDLETGISARAMYVRQGCHHHIAVSFPHVLIDGSGLENLLRRLERILEGETPPLPEPVDEASTWSACDQLYWRERMRGMSPSILNMADEPPPRSFDLESSHFAGESFVTLPEDLVAAARALCRERKITLFVFFYAVFNALVACKTGERRIVSGTTLNNRDSRTLRHIDCRITNVPICLEIEDARDYNAILEHTGERLSEAIRYANAPLNEIVQAAGYQGAPYRLLFMFQNQNTGYRMHIDGHPWREGAFRYRPLYTELCFQFQVDEADRLHLVVHYDPALYAQGEVDQLAAEYLALGCEFVGTLREVSHHA